MELLALLVKVFLLPLLAAYAKDIGRTFEHFLFPIRNLHRVNLEFLRDLLNSADILNGLKGNSGFELGFVSSSFSFHL